MKTNPCIALLFTIILVLYLPIHPKAANEEGRIKTFSSWVNKYHKTDEISESGEVIASKNAYPATNPGHFINIKQNSNKELGCQILTFLDQRSLDKVLAAFDDNAIFYGWDAQPVDKMGYKKIMSDLLAAFPDSKFVIHQAIAEGEFVAVRHHFEGTHTGAPFNGVPASNKKVFANAIVLYKFKDGKVAEAWLNADFLAILTQIGAIPSGN